MILWKCLETCISIFKYMAMLVAIYLKSRAGLIQATMTGEDDDACVLLSHMPKECLLKRHVPFSWMRYC